MTKLDEFRSWLYSFYGDCFNDEEAEVWLRVEEIVCKFDRTFADELKTEDEVVEESDV